MVRRTGVNPPTQRPAENDSLEEVKRMRSNLSLKLLRSIDDRVKSILYQTPFVTAYELKGADQWVRQDIEGFLYLLERDDEPLKCLILVNRKTERHLVEYITPQFQIARDGNFVFYRAMNIVTESMQNIRGLWFYDDKECLKTFEEIYAVTINKEPLSGFNSEDKPVILPSPTTEVQPTPITAVAPPHSSPRMSTKKDVKMMPNMYDLEQKDGFLHSGLNGHQRMNYGEPMAPTPSVPSMPMPSSNPLYPYSMPIAAGHNTQHHPPTTAVPLPKSNPMTAYPLQETAPQMLNNESNLWSNRMRSLFNGSDPSHSEYPQFPVGFPPSHYQPPPAVPRNDNGIMITYDMFCSAFSETVQSEEFLRLMWRRLSIKSWRNFG
ncbi:mRNA-decapping enzyme-like protein [Babesia sp. Xinjiang]|uniref:mRNA-decapping enzyme-like protein n=1 Tax=Babesia sp. Xinjiang TaxID=462227 RepID=UPI000A260BC3|nr:mRNA-decapping enzyme-like protein [Babesia sp. Xinjiang]ORM40223.1 mRNA-decapping enzyme-like protein [Babesia sp. Xinjiang]